MRSARHPAVLIGHSTPMQSFPALHTAPMIDRLAAHVEECHHDEPVVAL